MTAKTRDLEGQVLLINSALGFDTIREGTYVLDNVKNGVRREYCLQTYTDSGGVQNCSKWMEYREMSAHLDGMLRGIFAYRRLSE